ncbi:hypothetical protein LCGC14_1402400, partial [marine sediment metagenome]
MSKGGSDLSMRVVMGWVIGLSGIALMLLIMLILFGNLSGNVGFTNDEVTLDTVNESLLAFVNDTDYTVLNANSSNSNYAIVSIFNATTNGLGLFNFSIDPANATISSNGVVSNATALLFDNVSISYNYTNAFPSQGLADTNNFIA